MESQHETPCKDESENEFFEIKSESNDQASDRESSIESFHTNKYDISTTPDTELIDIDDIELSDEESWLYKSPRKLSSTEKCLDVKHFRKISDSIYLPCTMSKDALVRKLNELQMHGKANLQWQTNSMPESSNIQLSRTLESMKPDDAGKFTETTVKNKENDVLDVHKIAQQQEERLKESASFFLSQAGKRNLTKFSPLSSKKILCKPASVEAFNSCDVKSDAESLYSTLSIANGKKLTHFESSFSIHKKDVHHGSLPNINPNYNSLKSKKPKVAVNIKNSCPLPIYPAKLNGVRHESSQKGISLLDQPRESFTLPSSYRLRSNSSSRKHALLTPSRRRESTPLLNGLRNSISTTWVRRDSAPSKYISPLSSPILSQRGTMAPVLSSPLRKPPKHLVMVKVKEYPRSASQSPSRRLPFTTMHNRSPKHSPGSPRNEDMQHLKGMSKIPSPVLRSGIPQPSNQTSRTCDDESWSRDCY